MNASATDPSPRASHEQLILVSGATGYVGGRLAAAASAAIIPENIAPWTG